MFKRELPPSLRFLSALVLSLSLGCDELDDSVPDTESPSALAEPDPIGTGEAPEPESALPIGLIRQPGSEDAAWVQRNAAALRSHNAEEYGDAIAGWRAVLSADPAYDMARFNLACALSRTGDFAAAREELRVVLHHNLPRFSERFAEDEDLAPLRDSEEGSRLRREITSLGERYAEVSARGVVGVLRQRESSTSDERHRSTETLVTGVYLHPTRRFVPLRPPSRRVHQHDSCRECLESSYVLLSQGGTDALEVQSGFIPNHGISEPLLSLLPRPGRAGARHRVRDPDYSQIMGFEACATAGGFRFRGKNPDGWMPWRRLPSSASVAEDTSLCLYVTDDEEDPVHLRGAPPGYSLVDRSLITPSGSISLPSGATRGNVDTIVVHPGGRLVAFAAHTRGATSTHHQVQLLNIDTGDTQRLSDGRGLASLRIGGDGALYVQTDGVARYEPAVGTEAEETFEGLELF